MLENRNLSYADGPVDIPQDDTFLTDNVQIICICDTEEWVSNNDILLFWQVKPLVHVYQLSEEGPCEDLDGDSQLSSFSEWILPAKDFDRMWESLVYESGLKHWLLRYAASALLFTGKGVDPLLVAWNRIVLLHGPPGTRKTSLCKALAQKLSIRFSSRYPHSQLVEVNAHSLFSKWFSESGKLKIQDMVKEDNNLVFVLIDEVESLAAARNAALSGSEPLDSIRVVKALLRSFSRSKKEKCKYRSIIQFKTKTHSRFQVDHEVNSKIYLWRGNTMHLLTLQGGCRTGMAKVTNAYDLPARRVIHTLGPKYAVKYHTSADNALSHCYRSCLELLIENGLQSLLENSITLGLGIIVAVFLARFMNIQINALLH